MKGARYLPSTQFTLLVVSLAVSLGLVYLAQLVTHQTPAQIQVAATPTSDDSNWEATFDQIEAAQASSSLAAPDPNAVSELLSAAQSSNLTDSVSRSLFINLSSDESQGMGSDIPTQDELVAQAAAQIADTAATTTVYTISDLTIVSPTPTSLHTYGNAVMQTLAQYPGASEQATLLSVDEVVEGGATDQGPVLQQIGAAYKGAAEALAGIAVPQTLAPLHLELVNDFMQESATYNDISTIGNDSLRGLQGLQNYESDLDQEARVFTQIAQNLNNDGIIFTKDEPGNVWAGFLGSS